MILNNVQFVKRPVKFVKRSVKFVKRPIQFVKIPVQFVKSPLQFVKRLHWVNLHTQIPLLRSQFWPPTKGRKKSMLKSGILDMIPEKNFYWLYMLIYLSLVKYIYQFKLKETRTINVQWKCNSWSFKFLNMSWKCPEHVMNMWRTCNELLWTRSKHMSWTCRKHIVNMPWTSVNM